MGAVTGNRRDACGRISCVDLRERDQLEDVRVDGRITL